MGTIAQKLTYLDGTKQALKESINNIGGDITNETTFREYAEELDNIYDNLPKTTGESSNLSLTTLKGKMNIIPKGDTKQGKLPSTYQQVEYIESTGSAYIDTGIIPNTNTKIDVQFETIQRGNFGVIFGGEETYKDNSFHLYNSSGVFDIGFGSIATAFRTSIDYNSSVKYTLIMDKNGFNINGNTGTFPEPTISTTYSIYLFAVHRATNVLENNALKRIYYCKLYNNGTLVRDMIPCYRISDNVIGMYDLVSNTFFTNAGSGTFTKGANEPTPDTPIDIEVVTGTQEVKVENVNLLSGVEFGKYSDVTGNKLDDNSMYRNTEIISIKPSTTYTFSINGTTQGINKFYYDKNKNFINKASDTNGTFTTPNNAYYLNFYRGTSLGNTGWQFEEGSTSTPYTPHQEQTQTISLGNIELCKIGNYQDYLYKSNDKWYKKEYIGKHILSTSDVWALNRSSNNLYQYRTKNDLLEDVITSPDPYSRAVALCNYYTKGDINGMSTQCFNIGGLKYIGITSDISTLANFNTFITNNSIYVYYVCQTPQDIEITNTTLIEQLNNLEKLKSYNGVTNISSSGNLPMILNVSALKGE